MREDQETFQASYFTIKLLMKSLIFVFQTLSYSDNVKLINKVYRRFDDIMIIRKIIVRGNEENQKDEEKNNDYHAIQLSDPIYAV